MKKLVIVFFICCSLSFFNCVQLIPVNTGQTEQNNIPLAYLDEFPPISAIANSTLYFAGHGSDTNRKVVDYEWRSDIDGILSKADKFSTSKLSIGRHTIFFKVQDDKGCWSREVYTYTNIFADYSQKPEIWRFDLIPAQVLLGESTILRWDVAYAVKVNISPDIGDIASSGARVLYPLTDTTYIITAENTHGTVTKQVMLSILNEQTKNLDIFSLAEEDGSINSHSAVDPDLKVGITNIDADNQAFLSFDISSIPTTAKIQSVSLDLSNYVMVGHPFSYLGAMGIFYQNYDFLDGSDYFDIFPSEAIYNGSDYYDNFPSGAIYTAYVPAYYPYMSLDMTYIVQQLIYQGAQRFQIRVQFEKYYFGGESENYLLFDSKLAKLQIVYLE